MDYSPEHNAHDSTHSAQQETADNIHNMVAPVVIVDEQGHAYTKRQNAYNRFTNGIKGFSGRIDHGERWMILLTAIVAFTTVSQTVQSCNNNRSTAAQVDRLIDAANRVDDAAESFSKSASGINGGVSDAVTKLDAQAKATQRSANAAQQNVEALKRGLEVQQRSWVGIDNGFRVTNVKLTAKGLSGEIDIPLKNFGNSVAFRTVADAEFYTKDIPMHQNSACDLIAGVVGVKPNGLVSPPDPIFSQHKSWGHLLYPGQPFMFSSMAGTDENVMDKVVYIAGCLRYRDQFDHPHWIKFCYETNWLVTSPESFNGLTVCNADNYSDDSQTEKNAKRPN